MPAQVRLRCGAFAGRPVFWWPAVLFLVSFVRTCVAEAQLRRQAHGLPAVDRVFSSGRELRPSSSLAILPTAADDASKLQAHKRRRLAQDGFARPPPPPGAPTLCPAAVGEATAAEALVRRGFLPLDDAAETGTGCWRRAPCLCEAAMFRGDWTENCASHLHAEDLTDLEGGDPRENLASHTAALWALAPLLAGRATAFVGDSVSQQFYSFLR